MTPGGSFSRLLGSRKVAAKALPPRRRSLSNARTRRPSYGSEETGLLALFLAHLDFFLSANPRHAFPIDFEAFPPHQRGDGAISVARMLDAYLEHFLPDAATVQARSAASSLLPTLSAFWLR